MNKQKLKIEKSQRRKKRVRAKIFGTAVRPRLSVFRSAKHISVQVIDDTVGKTLVCVSDRELKGSQKKPMEKAFEVGKLVAQKLKEKKIETVVFDKNAYLYHGRVKAVAEGARESGLKF